MKVGILTMQRVKNSGSFLQAYGLMRVVESYGHKVEFVDFELNKEIELKEKKEIVAAHRSILFRFLKWMKNHTLPGDRKFIVAQKRIKKFFDGFETEYYKELGIESCINLLPKVDILIIGSDEVFNIAQYNELGYEIPWQLLGEGADAKKVITYAASCGHTTLNNLSEYGLADKMKSLLLKMDALSVRDQHTSDVVQTLTGVEPSINIDPVLLYDFHDVKLKPPALKKYILVYGYNFRINDPTKIAAGKAFAKSKQMKLVCVNVMQRWCDEFIVTSPLEMLSYFKYADYIVTDTFHGAVISIKYNKSMGVFTRQSNNQKITGLLNQFKLGDHIVRDTNDFDSIMNKDIDYKAVNDTLNLEIQKSYEYLKNNLEF